MEASTAERQEAEQRQAQLAAQVAAAQAEAAAMERKFLEERAERRKVHEQLQVLRGNIRVMCRVRPPQASGESAITYPLPGALCVQPPDKRSQEFEFDAVFSPHVSQAEVFDEVLPLVRSCADGYNVCIFAYGQTGSGKTHTIFAYGQTGSDKTHKALPMIPASACVR
ncbi:hypothetical protein WJX72_006007 [[Myrmecia] bisecta]|uniref:Kinesin motor domain-containing protein n=1 Tax=[Myrmecia] bisecta TaxID=41462 RepID=A0AAW1P754_9CHLO